MVQTITKIQNSNKSNQLFFFFLQPKLHKNQKQRKTQVTECKTIWHHHCVEQDVERKQSTLVIFEFLHVKVSKSAGEFVLVNVLVLRDVFVGAVRPRAARRPPEKTLLLVRDGA